MEDKKKRSKAELEKILTPKQKRFCELYIIDLNGAKAARDAGYTKNGDRNIASETLAKPYIQEYIELIRNDIEDQLGLSKMKVVREWMKIAFGDISNLFDIGPDGVTMRDPLEFGELPNDVTATISEVEHTKYGIRVKFHPKTTALTQIAMLLGYNSPIKTDVTTAGEKVENSVSLSVDGDKVKLK